MARGKKKECLTPEERLQAALVPESEQPYKIPGNWCWTYIKSGFDVTSSKRVHKGDWLSQGIPFYRTRELVKLSDNGCVDNELFISEKLYNSFVEEYGVPQEGDLLISGVGTIGVPYVINENQKFYFKDGNIIWFKNRGLFHPKYVYFLYKSAFIDNQIHQMSSGTTVDTYTIINANATVVPLPPFSEQQRIVDRIESLFSKLDEARQKAQEALDSFETRKAAILHKAFIGELTAQWRKENGVGMESWENRTVGQVCHDVKVGIVIKPSQYYTDEEKGTPAFRSANVRENRIDDFDWVYLNRAGMENNSRSIVHTGDVLVVRSGNPGTACVVSEKFDGYNAIDILIAVPDHSQISSEFLCTYTNSPFGKNLIFENKRGMALVHFNVKGYSGLPIRVPQLNEQGEIIRILDDLLAKEQQAKEAAEGVLEQIDLIKKAILARAFRGELGTNDPTEESAVELLKALFEA